MDEKELFLTIAQTALGIAGFSGVMGAFMKRPGKLNDVETYRVGVLLGISFSAMFLAFLPLLLGSMGAMGPRLWVLASATMAAFSIIALTTFLLASWRVSRHAPEIFNPWIMGATALGHFANILLQLVSASEPGASAAGVYVAGLLWYLFHAAVQFSRMLFVQPADR
jgi:hypothetical protein